jgi:phospholipid/cholesterol/gamma-HCH transport system substrate-binding protein
MARQTANHFRLGIFVIAGMFFLVLLLYVIGKNQGIFGASFPIRARFENVNGLLPGNNVRFAGIHAGTVKSVEVINDSTIEVTMLIQNKMRPHIRANAVASIGSDGLMGNKLVNIQSAKGDADLVVENSLLASGTAADTDQMLKILGETNNELATVVEGLKTTINRINNSSALWEVLNDESLPANLRTSLINVRSTTSGMNQMVNDLQRVVDHVQAGRGSVGSLIMDTAFSYNLNQAVEKLKKAGDMADTISSQVASLVRNIDRNVNQGQGVVTALLKDTSMVRNMEATLLNIEKGTSAFNENMEALKSNFLFRGYFRRQEQKRRQALPSN